MLYAAKNANVEATFGSGAYSLPQKKIRKTNARKVPH